ncbi:MAG: hypothetical protein WCG95_09540, partial [bacterium]
MRITPTMNNQTNATNQKRQPNFKGIISLEVSGIEDRLISFLPEKFEFLAKASGASELLGQVKKDRNEKILSQKFVLWCKDRTEFKKIVEVLRETSTYLEDFTIFRRMTKE